MSYLKDMNIARPGHQPRPQPGRPACVNVVPAPGKRDLYLNITAQLKPQLEQIEGFISVEHFQSLTHPDKMLSLSFFRNEAAIET